MKRLALVLGSLALASQLALAQTSTWKIDSNHSEVAFTVKHLSISNVHGHFGKIEGAILFNDAEPAKSSVNVTIDVNAVDTAQQARDTHLRSADFFDTTQFPTATYVSTSVYKSGNQVKILGNLTLHGVTKPVELTVEGPTPPITGNDKKLHTGYSATATLHRSDFGIGPKFPNAMVSEDVALVIDLEVVKQ